MSISSPSPTCTVNATSTVNGVNVTNPSTVTVALADPSGVAQWSLSCVGVDELNATAAINAGLMINSTTKTATFPAPVAGSALIFQSQVNGGLNQNGVVDPTKTTTFGVYCLTANGYRAAAFNEMLEGNAAFGWVAKLNQVMRNALGSSAGAGAGITYSGGVYAVGQNADGSVVVNAHDVQLKPAFSALLNGATSAATASALAQRDASGNCSFATVTGTTVNGTSGTIATLGTTTLTAGNASSAATASYFAQRDASGNCSFNTVTGTTVNGTTATIATVNTTTLNASNATSAATASALAQRDASGNCSFATVTASAVTCSGNMTVGVFGYVTTPATSGSIKYLVVTPGGSSYATGNNLLMSGGYGNNASSAAATYGNIQLGYGALPGTVGQNTVWIATAGANPPYNAGTISGCTIFTAPVTTSSNNYTIAAYTLWNYTTGVFTPQPETTVGNLQAGWTYVQSNSGKFYVLTQG